MNMMVERGKDCKKKICIILLLSVVTAASFFTQCCAGRSMHLPNQKDPHHHSTSVIRSSTKKLKVTEHDLDLASFLLQRETMDSSNTDPYVSSPFSLTPYDSLAPLSLPGNTPPFCVYPPNIPQFPPAVIPSPTSSPTPSPPPPPFYNFPPVLPTQSPPPSPPQTVPSPPPVEITPSPIIYFPSPPLRPILSPPYYEPSPPSYIPNPPSVTPSPPSVFHPPVVYPPPTVPPPPRTGPSTALWCVAKPSVPDPIIQEAMNYACGSGADCDSIQPSGSCFAPNTVYAHASFAFNSYWQRTKAAGGTCSFGGTAMLVTVDPSFDGCHFLYI